MKFPRDAKEFLQSFVVSECALILMEPLRFYSRPFTMQRLCEQLLNTLPHEIPVKICRAMEKIITVNEPRKLWTAMTP